jgi:hypothetical protein
MHAAIEPKTSRRLISVSSGKRDIADRHNSNPGKPNDYLAHGLPPDSER